MDSRRAAADDSDARDLSGLREWVNERPLTGALGFACELIEPGRAIFLVEPPASWHNPNGSLPGALLVAAADFSAGMAAASVTGTRDYVATVDLGLHFLQPAFTALARSETAVLRAGARLVFLQTTITDADGELIATGLGSYGVGRGVGQRYPIGADADPEYPMQAKPPGRPTV